MIKAIAFDFKGVVMPGPIAEWAEKNLTHDDDKYKLLIESSRKWDVGEIPLEEAYQIMSQITGVASNKIWETFFENKPLNEEVIEIIKNLKKHYKIGLFSNHIGELVRKILYKHQITDLFDEILISSEHRKKKPDPKFFKILLIVMGVKKDDIIFIDDSSTNVQAAISLGIKAIFYKNPQQLIIDLNELGISLK